MVMYYFLVYSVRTNLCMRDLFALVLMYLVTL